MGAVIVFIDRQHAGKPSRPSDRGAVSSLGYDEVDVTTDYIEAARVYLEAHGVDVRVITSGEYRDRHRVVNATDAALYLAAHCNAGLGGRSGDRSETYHWPGSERGGSAAQLIAVRLGRVQPWPARVISANTDRTRATLAGVRCPAILLEPGFLDGALGASWLQAPINRIHVGNAIAAGVLDWIATL